MNIYSQSLPEEQGQQQKPTLPGWLGTEIIETGARFSLASARLGKHVMDVMTEYPKLEDYGRFLVVGNDAVDESIWDNLVEKDIHRLPLIKKDHDTWVFGIKDGLKPLANEALFDRPSSETYISDLEIYFELGRIYRNVYEATDVLLLEGNIEEVSPVEHVAISSFSDGHGYLFLYPPYRVSDQYRNLEISQARNLFTQSLKARFDRLVLYQESFRDVAQQLVEKASQGFNEG